MEANLAVLIDFENIAAGTEKEGLGRFDVDAIMKRLKDKGRILIARSYADWGRFARFKQGLLAANVNMYELTSHGMHDKNRADIALVVDALDLAFTKDYIDTYVIVSGDSDFTPLALKMRELNKRVIGVGTRSSTSRLLIQACDEFIFYDSIVERTRARRRDDRPVQDAAAPMSLSKADAFDLLTDTVEGMIRENPDPPHSSVVKTAMRRKRPDFSENELGFATFARFLEVAAENGKVKLNKDQKGGGYRVEPVESATLAPAQREPARDDESRTSATEPWPDPYLPAGVEPWVDMLTFDGINPLAAPTRLAILELLLQNVRERDKRKRRITLQFVQEDVRRQMKRTHPDVPSRAIRAVFNTLMRSNVLVHKDGAPVRTASAPFNVEKDADQLNYALANVYLQVLHTQGADLRESRLLAELLLGNPDRTKDIEEMIAWLQAPDSAVDLPVGEDDLDSLLTMDEDTGESTLPRLFPSREDETDERTVPRVDRDHAFDADLTPAVGTRAQMPDDLDALLDVGPAAPKAAKPARSAKTEKPAKAQAPAEKPAKAEKKPAESKPAKAPKASTGTDDLDALLDIGGAEDDAGDSEEGGDEGGEGGDAARKPRRRRAPSRRRGKKGDGAAS